MEEEISQQVPGLEGWWTALGDTTLTALIAQAETSNLDVAAALGRLKEVRAARRKALGTAVCGGMLMATVAGVFMIPFMYRIVQEPTP